MGGLKHNLHRYGYLQQNPSKTEDPILRDLEFRSMQITPLCKLCGKEILPPSSDEGNRAQYYNWELDNETHYFCNASREREQQERYEHMLAIAEKEAAKKEEEKLDWDEYMEKMMKVRDIDGAND